MQRSAIDEEERLRRDTRPGSSAAAPHNHHQQPQQQQQQSPPQQQLHHQPAVYGSRSPTMAQPLHQGYSTPMNGTMPSSSSQHHYNTNYGSRPSSSAAMQVNSGPSPSRPPPPPHSPTNGVAQPSRNAYSPREAPKSTFYDPTSEHRESPSAWTAQSYDRGSMQVSLHSNLMVTFVMSSLKLEANSQPQHRENSTFYDAKSDTMSRPNHKSPTASHFSHRDPVFSTTPTYPTHRPEPSSHIVNGMPSPHQVTNQPSISHIVNGASHYSHEQNTKTEPEPTPKAIRRADPMSFSNILSHNTEPSRPVVKQPIIKTEANHTPSQLMGLDSLSTSIVAEKSTPSAITRKMPVQKASPVREIASKSTPRSASRSKPRTTTSLKKSSFSSDKENSIRVKQPILDIERDETSDLDVDGPEWGKAHQAYLQKSQKRLRDVDEAENSRRKV